jgi:ClpP class serine protease
MDIAYPQIADRLFGRAHAIEPEAFRAIVESPIARRIMSGEKPGTDGSKSARKAKRQRMSALVEGEWIKSPNGMSEYFVTSAGVAVLPVMGILSQRFDWLSALCGWTTYEGLSAMIDATEQDYRVKARLLDVESPGGECAGMLDAADKIIAARSGKPIWAVANAYALSAAYAIAGSASQLIVPRLCSVGSIGAVCFHVDQSAADQAMGLKYTAIFSGDRKVDGWDHAPLSKDARASAQASVDHCRNEFAVLVDRQGRMSASAALATEAATYFDELAVKAGLANAVGSFDDALAELSDLAARRSQAGSIAATAAQAERISTMAKTPETTTATAPVAEAPAAAPAAVEPAVAPALAAAPAAPVAAAPAAAAEHDDGEMCPECGRKLAPDASADATASSDALLAATIETLDLCALSGATVAQARGFIAAKTPVAEVRAKLVAQSAAKSAEQEIRTTPDRAPAADAGWGDVTAQVNRQFGVSRPKG